MWRAAGWVVGEYVRFGEPVYEGGGVSCFKDLSQCWGGRRVGQREGCQESGDGAEGFRLLGREVGCRERSIDRCRERCGPFGDE